MRAGWPRWSRSNRLLPSGACGAPHARTSSVQMSCGPSSSQSLPRSAASTSGHRSSPVRRGCPTRSGARPLPLSEAAIRTSAGLRLRCSYRSAAAPHSRRSSSTIWRRIGDRRPRQPVHPRSRRRFHPDRRRPSSASCALSRRSSLPDARAAPNVLLFGTPWHDRTHGGTRSRTHDLFSAGAR